MQHLTKSLLVFALGCALVVAANAEPRDPRIGEWREDHYAGGVGLYMIYEDLGNGVTRTHSGENLAPRNRLHDDARCDGKYYPRLDATGDATEITVSCAIINERTVTFSQRRKADSGWVEGEGKWILSDDGTHSVGSFVRKDRDGKVVELVTRLFTRNTENCLNHADDAKFRECQQRTRPARP